MIKKFLVSILVIAGFLSCQVQAADAFKEGVNYKVIAQRQLRIKRSVNSFRFGADIAIRFSRCSIRLKNALKMKRLLSVIP